MRRTVSVSAAALGAAFGQPNYRIADLKITEIVADPANFISEVSIAMPKSERWGFTALARLILKDGTMLAFGVFGNSPPGGSLFLSEDPMRVVVVSPDGRIWSEKDASVLYPAPNYDTRDLSANRATVDSGYRHIGYPSAVVLDDGTVLAAFHSFDQNRKQIVLIGRFRMVKQ